MSAGSTAAALLEDVLLRRSELSDEIGGQGLLVHAEHAEARSFYLHLVPELEPSPTTTCTSCSS